MAQFRPGQPQLGQPPLDYMVVYHHPITPVGDSRSLAARYLSSTHAPILSRQEAPSSVIHIMPRVGKGERALGVAYNGRFTILPNTSSATGKGALELRASGQRRERWVKVG